MVNLFFSLVSLLLHNMYFYSFSRTKSICTHCSDPFGSYAPIKILLPKKDVADTRNKSFIITKITTTIYYNESSRIDNPCRVIKIIIPRIYCSIFRLWVMRNINENSYHFVSSHRINVNFPSHYIYSIYYMITGHFFISLFEVMEHIIRIVQMTLNGHIRDLRLRIFNIFRPFISNNDQ